MFMQGNLHTSWSSLRVQNVCEPLYSFGVHSPGTIWWQQIKRTGVLKLHARNFYEARPLHSTAEEQSMSRAQVHSK